MAVSGQRAFSDEEYAGRLARVRAAMTERGADVLLVDALEHLAYVAGYSPTATRYQACAIPLDGGPVALVRTVDERKFVEESWIGEYTAFADWEDPIEVLAQTFRQRGWAAARVAVETDSLPHTMARHKAMKAALPEATFVDFSRALWELRLRKSPAEIAYMRQAAAVADAAMWSVVQAASEGRTEREIAAVAYATSMALGADNAAVGPIISGGRVDALHGVLGAGRLAAGDILHMEITPRVRGYTGRIMRPTSIGEPSRSVRDAAERLLAIQDAQLAAMRPGAIAADVDRVCREGVLKAGLRDTHTTSTGYTIGYIANPVTSDFTRVFVPTADWALEEGMTFHMYTSARGLAFSESVLVTAEGHERLTRLERRLFVR